MEIDQIVTIAVNALEDVKGENILVLDTHMRSSLFSRIIICSGNSNRQVNALISKVEEAFTKEQIPILGIEGRESGEWVLLDGGDVIIHVLLPATREYYSLETLWDENSIK